MESTLELIRGAYDGLLAHSSPPEYRQKGSAFVRRSAVLDPSRVEVVEEAIVGTKAIVRTA